MLLVFSGRSIAVYVFTVTQYISLWADCQQVENVSSQHFGRWRSGGGGSTTHARTRTVGRGCLACVFAVAGMQHPGITCSVDVLWGHKEKKKT